MCREKYIKGLNDRIGQTSPLRYRWRGGWPLWANLAVVDHKTHGYPDKTSVPCVGKRGTGRKIEITAPFPNNQDISRGNVPDVSKQWEPLSHWWFYNKTYWLGQRPEVSLPKNTINITSDQPQVAIEMVGHLIEFVIDTSATLLVLTQGIGSFNNHEKYGREFQERDRGTLP